MYIYIFCAYLSGRRHGPTWTRLGGGGGGGGGESLIAETGMGWGWGYKTHRNVMSHN